MDKATKRKLEEFVADVSALPNESAKTHRFIGLVEALFPGTRASAELAGGVEKMVRIEIAKDQERPRFIDQYYGDAVIEFEDSLRATEDEAKRQLREQVSGVWRGSGRRQLLAVATDGIEWKTFRPRSEKQKPSPDEIELVPLREFKLSEDTLREFWIWLTSLLFRDARTEATAERFRIDFGATSIAYSDAMQALEEAWHGLAEEPEAHLAFEVWQQYLTITYGSLTETPRPELQRLFLKHTYLASVSRFLVWAMLSGGRTSDPLRSVANSVLSGEYFQGEGIENLVEDDFFQWVRRPVAEKILASVWERTLDQIQTYDLTGIGQDVLKGVYQELVDPKDRHDLGEYYTPEWLCERVVAEVLPEEGMPSVIDPTCGSGSFLRAAIAHIRSHNPGGTAEERLSAILGGVVGIDIHPLAVTIARATYVLALGDLVREAKRPVQVPVYLADSLFLPSEVRQFELGEAPAYKVSFGGKEVQVPEALVLVSDLFDRAMAVCAEVAVDHAAGSGESRDTFAAYLMRAAPRIDDVDGATGVIDSLWELTEALADLIRAKQNSIWAFIIRNGYRPAMLRGQFDYVIGNPPWLSYRYISDPAYQKEVKKRAVEDYGIAPRAQRLVTQMELAVVFLVHALKTFGRDGAQLAFVMPRSILSADQHSRLREKNYVAPVDLREYWDLWDVVPLFNVPTCVVFADRRQPERFGRSYKLPVLTWEGRLPERDIPWREAAKHLTVTKDTAHLVYLAERTALSTRKGQTKPGRGSKYRTRFHQGATLVPRNLYFVEVPDLTDPVDPEKLYSALTEPEQARLAKAPYDDINMKGLVEGRFLYLTALSDNLLPFVLRDPKLVVLPVHGDKSLRMMMADELREAGFRYVGKWMREAEKLWTERRGRKADKQSIYERLDYHSGLTRQDPDTGHLVVYNAAGTNLSAARVERADLPLPFVVEHKLYYARCDSIAEADYVAAVLNSEAVNDAIKPFQSTGLMGPRDIEKKVLDLPIPVFNPSNEVHDRVAKLGASARGEAWDAVEQAASDNTLPSRLGDRRGFVRNAIRESLVEIDRVVEELLRRAYADR